MNILRAPINRRFMLQGSNRYPEGRRNTRGSTRGRITAARSRFERRMAGRHAYMSYGANFRCYCSRQIYRRSRRVRLFLSTRVVIGHK